MIPGLSLALTPGLALALALGLPLALAPGLPLGPQPYNPFVFGPGPKAMVVTHYDLGGNNVGTYWEQDINGKSIP